MSDLYTESPRSFEDRLRLAQIDHTAAITDELTAETLWRIAESLETLLAGAGSKLEQEVISRERNRVLSDREEYLESAEGLRSLIPAEMIDYL